MSKRKEITDESVDVFKREMTTDDVSRKMIIKNPAPPQATLPPPLPSWLNFCEESSLPSLLFSSNVFILQLFSLLLLPLCTKEAHAFRFASDSRKGRSNLNQVSKIHPHPTGQLFSV